MLSGQDWEAERKNVKIKRCVSEMKETGKKTNGRLAVSVALICTLVCGIMVSPLSADAAFAKSRVKVTASKKRLCVGQKAEVTIKGTGKAVRKWTSSRKSVIKVKKTGKRKARITAVRTGTAYIKARVGGKTYKVKVRAERPRLNHTAYTLAKGKSFTLSVSGTKSVPKVAVSNKKVVKIKKISRTKYKVTALAVGSSKVTLRINGRNFTCRVRVKAAEKSLSLSNARSEILKRVNGERQKRGLAPLKAYDALNETAQVKAEDMYKNKELSHYSKKLGYFYDQYEKAGIVYLSGAENIAKGQDSAASVMKAWMESPGHRSAILNRSYTHLGVGYYKGYWVQQFAEIISPSGNVPE